MKSFKKTGKKWALALALALTLTCVGVSAQLVHPASAETVAAVDPTDPMSVYTSANPIPDIAERVRPAVVQVISVAKVWSPYTGETTETEMGYGSGVYIDDRGYIVTNNHVVADAESVNIVWLDGTTMEAEIVGTDSATDLAVLKFEGSVDAQPVPLGDSDALRVGELAIAIGNPGSGDTVLYGTVTSGIISGLDREGIEARDSYTENMGVIQTTAQINSGNSGGALLNGNGELIGIPTLKASFSSDSVIEGTGFAIPINDAKPIIDELSENGRVLRPRLGISVVDQDGPEEPLRTYPPAGVEIRVIEEGSPAEEAGLQVYDRITHVNGERCMNYDEMDALLDGFEAGDTVTLTVARYYDARGNELLNPEVFDVEVELQILD